MNYRAMLPVTIRLCKSYFPSEVIGTWQSHRDYRSPMAVRNRRGNFGSWPRNWKLKNVLTSKVRKLSQNSLGK